MLKMPILGGILRKIAVARFCRTLSTLLVLGRADPRRARHHRAHRGQRHHRGRDPEDARGIERGETVSEPLRETNVFPSMVVQMINVGETTGALDAMLSKIADFYEEEVDTAVAGLLTLIEPV